MRVSVALVRWLGAHSWSARMLAALSVAACAGHEQAQTRSQVGTAEQQHVRADGGLVLFVIDEPVAKSSEFDRFICMPEGMSDQTPAEDDIDRQLRELTEGRAGSARYSEPSAAKRAKAAEQARGRREHALSGSSSDGMSPRSRSLTTKGRDRPSSSAASAGVSVTSAGMAMTGGPAARLFAALTTSRRSDGGSAHRSGRSRGTAWYGEVSWCYDTSGGTSYRRQCPPVRVGLWSGYSRPSAGACVHADAER